MLARKQGPRACGAVPRIGPLLTLLAPVLLLVSASHIEAARNTCDSACRECKTSCASQKLNCLTHTRADLGSALRDCASGRSRRSCRRLARQRFMLARSECIGRAAVPFAIQLGIHTAYSRRNDRTDCDRRSRRGGRRRK